MASPRDVVKSVASASSHALARGVEAHLEGGAKVAIKSGWSLDFREPIGASGLCRSIGTCNRQEDRPSADGRLAELGVLCGGSRSPTAGLKATGRLADMERIRRSPGA